MPETSTFVRETLIIQADEVLTFSPALQFDSVAIYLVSKYEQALNLPVLQRAPLDPEFINYGTIIATNPGTIAAEDMTILAFTPGSNWDSVTVENHGVMSAQAQAGFVRVFFSGSWSPSILNTGVMYASAATGSAITVFTYGLDLWWKPWSIHNTVGGEIIAEGERAWAVMSIFANFVNDGELRATGGSIGGIGFRSNGGYIENNGEITATSDVGQRSWGIALGAVDGINGPRNSTIINTGLISAETAIDELYDGGVRTDVFNSGQIVGDIILYNGADSVRNSGSIAGDITLGAGDDIYDGRGGQLVGAIDAGAGNDTVHLGSHGGVASGGADFDTGIAFYGDGEQAVTTAINETGVLTVILGGVVVAIFDGFERFEITGGSGYDTITTAAGDDFIDLGLGGGSVDGAAGNDTVRMDFSDAAAPVIYAHDSTGAIATIGGVNAVIVTNVEAINVVGGAASDALSGGAGDDTLAGGAGGDVLTGGAGIDWVLYNGSPSGVIVSLETGGVVDGGDATGDVLNEIEGVRGSSYGDVLIGGSGADYLDGGHGEDVLQGGAGNDVYYVDSVGDVVIEGVDSGLDRIETSVSLVLAAHVEELRLVGEESLSATGNQEANTIVGNAGDNLIEGLGGADRVEGGAGFDTLSYASSTAGVQVSMQTGFGVGGDAEGDDFSGIEAIIGSAYADVITGTIYSDWLEGGAGADTLNGGSNGDDTLSYASSNAAVRVNIETGVVSGGHADGDVISNFDSVVGSAFSDVLIGHLYTIRLEGGGGNDVLAATSGALDGGEGYDIIDLGAAWMGVIVDMDRAVASISGTVMNLISIEGANGGGYDDALWGDGGDNQLSGLGGNDLIEGRGGADTLIGGAGDDVLVGGEGADFLSGGAGSDILAGGAGNDTYTIDDIDDQIMEFEGQGIDALRSSITIELGDNVESLFLLGVADTSGFGNSGDNLIEGNAGVNILVGRDGSDTLRGHEGADSLYGEAGADTLEGGAASDLLDGGSDADALYGGEGVDTIYGRAGSDTLDGGAGPDTMYGGDGDDLYFVNDAGDAPIESASAGIDIVVSWVSFSLGAYIENMALAGTGAINGTGNALANVITGNSAANTLSGLAGADTLNGGGADDVLYGGNGNDVLNGGLDQDILDGGSDNDTLDGGAGNDTLYGRSGLDGLSGAAGADTLYGGDGNDTLNGGANDDMLDGGNHNDTLNGGDSGDTMYGRQHDDTLNGDTGNDTLYGGDGVDALNGGGDNDLLDGGNGIDVLNGGDGADTLYGRNGADTLDGGLGADTLSGGNDADTFVFSTALGSGNIDAIQFYSVAQDTIQLDVDVFSAIGLGTLAANAFVIGAAATTADHRIIYDATTGALYYDADGDGAGAAVQFATLGTGLALTNADFVGGP